MSLQAALPETPVEIGLERRRETSDGDGRDDGSACSWLADRVCKSSFDTQNSELTDMSSRLVLLDRILAHYGPESHEARDQLRRSVVRALEQMESRDRASLTQSDSSSPGSEGLYDKVQALSPKADAQRSAQSQALGIVIGLGKRAG